MMFLQSIKCRLGNHMRPIWTAEIEHDKKRRKVYGMRAFTICPHCRKEIPSVTDKGTFING